MQTDSEKQPVFQLSPAIDSLAQLLRSTWQTAGGMTTVYCDRLRNANALAFEMAEALPSAAGIAANARQALQQSMESLTVRQEEPAPMAEEAVASVAASPERVKKPETYAAPALTAPGNASKRSRKGSHPMH